MRVTLIVNPVSGRHGADPSKVARALATAQSTLAGLGADVALGVTERSGHATELAARAVERGAERVIVWGGDGTINEVLPALVSSPAALAIVPSGSGNGLARALGVPLDAGRALRLAVSGSLRRVDVGEAAGRTFVNVAGVGFDAHVARLFNRERKGRLGLSAYVRITVLELRRYVPCRCRVVFDSGVTEAWPLLIALANSPQYGNGATVAPRARMDDGVLDVVIVERLSPLRDLLRARRLFTGTLARDPHTRVRQAASLRIEGDRLLPAHVDGQPFDGGPVLDVGMRPQALSVVVPQA
jgi:YegS/Rv2252/BmrU family lipid kinase